MDETFGELVDAGVDTRRACKLVGRPRSTYYWRRKPRTVTVRAPRPRPANALDDEERERILALLRDPAFVDKAPAQVWARLLDQVVYLCSVSTMYRLLRAGGESRERRRQATHPSKAKPELVTHAPGQIYSWDITKLRGPFRGVWYDLYVMLDIFSRYVVGWRVEETETGELAAEFLDDVIRTYGKPTAVHADRGTSMTSKNVAQLLVDLDGARSHSRPHVCLLTPTARRRSRRSSTAPPSPTTSTTSTTPARSARNSSITTVTSTTTPGSDCTPPHPSTSEQPKPSAPTVPSSSPPPTPATPNGSAAGPNLPSSPPSRGSTHPTSTPDYRTTDSSVSKKS